MVVVSGNADNLCAIGLSVENFGSLKIGRDKMQALNPARTAWAATALARLPVEEQLTISNPKFLAWVRATATTRSLKLRLGKQTASFLMYSDLLRSRSPRLEAFTSGVKPTGRVASCVQAMAVILCSATV